MGKAFRSQTAKNTSHCKQTAGISYQKCKLVLVIKTGRDREDMGHQILVPEAETIT